MEKHPTWKRAIDEELADTSDKCQRAPESQMDLDAFLIESGNASSGV